MNDKEIQKKVVWCSDRDAVSQKNSAKAENKTFDAAFNASAFNIFANAVKNTPAGQNVLISPLSIYLALGMTASGARNNTLSQMEGVLGGLPLENIMRDSGELSNTLSQSESVNFKIANSIWVNNKGDVAVNSQTADKAKDCFSADIFTLPFDKEAVKVINEWVNRTTHGTIKNILSKLSPLHVAVLVNALYFEADWKCTYDTAHVQKSTFTLYSGKKITNEMMFSRESCYITDDGVTGFVKPYANEKYAFVALLPNEGEDVYKCAGSLNGERFASLVKNGIRSPVEAAIPRFTQEYCNKLNDILLLLGMTDAFDEDKADFSALIQGDRNVFISDVIHKTFIELSPRGTKAGAATAVIPMKGASRLREPIPQVYLDRPFVYAIANVETGMPLFLGVVVDTRAR